MRPRRIFSYLVVLIVLFALALGTPVLAQQGNRPIRVTNTVKTDYFTSNTILYADGTSLDEYIINGPPTPPAGYEEERQSVAPSELSEVSGEKTLSVPAFNWYYGCSATSGSMIAAYWDNNGYSNMYTGPTNGGVMPFNNSVWSTWVDGARVTYGQCPLTASRNGLDGMAAKGSIDDYWVAYGSGASDPYLTGSWTQHTYGDAIGDYMGTSQSALGNTDGSTTFYTWQSLPTQLTCSDMVDWKITKDGTYGRKLFYEARGYTVTDCYNQKTDNTIAGGFSFAQYKAEIDQGRPVMINLNGHTVVGVGYNDTGNTVYIHDTWDFSNHTFSWGGSYSGMQLLSVSIVNLAPLQPAAFNKISPSDGIGGLSRSVTLNWGTSENSTFYEYCINRIMDGACSAWNPISSNSTVLSNLDMGATYKWQVRAANGTFKTFADGAESAYWTFTVANPPAAFIKTSPADAAIDQPTDLTLSWGPSTEATSFEYCFDADGIGDCDGTWKSITTNSATVTGLSAGTTYYWQVRAVNAVATTYANGVVDDYSTFETTFRPASFYKAAPADGATMAPVSPTLGWSASSGFESLEYCIYSTDSNDCVSNAPGWTVITANSVTLPVLIKGATYHWQIRAHNSQGDTYADGSETAFWSFTVGDVPGAFAKSTPKLAVTGVSLFPTLSWASSAGAAGYEYCISILKDETCAGNWKSTTSTSVTLSNLKPLTVYYWQVRAVNDFGTTVADTDWFTFTTEPAWVYLPNLVK